MFFEDECKIHSLEEVEEMLKRCNWKAFFNLIHSIGPDLNKPSWRMMKGMVIDLALEKSCDEELKYVDEVGFDFVYRSDGKITRIEAKSEMNMFYKDSTAKTKGRNTYKNKIKLKNTMGELDIKNLPDQLTFDYLLLIQTSGQEIISLVPLDKIIPHLNPTSDQIKIEQLREEEMRFISPTTGFDYDKIESNPSDNRGQTNLNYEIMKIIRKFLDEKMDNI